MTPVFEVGLGGYCDVVGVAFAPRTGRLVPALTDLRAVELKLDDAAGVVRQAFNNRFHVPLSYAAMPESRIDRMRAATRRLFAEHGIGLLRVARSGLVSVEIEPVRSAADGEHLRRKLWRRRAEQASHPQPEQIA